MSEDALATPTARERILTLNSWCPPPISYWFLSDSIDNDIGRTQKCDSLSFALRELEVLRLVRDGNRNKQIADQLSISETTVNFHIKNIVDKLQANDRTHAVTIALRRGLLEI